MLQMKDTVELLKVQNIDQPQSRVQKFLKKYDLTDNSQLCVLQSWLELVYGYRFSRSNQKVARGVASAGGIYPTNIYLFLKNKGKLVLLLYVFETHQFYEIETSLEDLIQLSQQMLFHEDNIYVFIASDVEKTITRYGIRGYRYCIVDAGQLISSLINLTPIDSFLAKTSDTLHNIQKKSGISWLICILAFKFSPELISKCLPPMTSKQLHPKFIGHEYFETNLLKLKNIHRESISFKQERILLTSFLKTLPAKNREDIIQKRYSSSSFTKKHLSLDQFNSILYNNCFEDFIYSDAIQFEVYVIALRINGKESGIYQFHHGLKQITTTNAVELENDLYLACQKQSVAKECSFALVFSLKINDNQPPTFMSYFKYFLNLGFIDANLYYQATANNIGNTCIGGFDDAKVKNLINIENIYPVLIHVFGECDNSLNKIDAVYLEEV